MLSCKNVLEFLFSNLIGLAYIFPSNKLLDTQVLIKTLYLAIIPQQHRTTTKSFIVSYEDYFFLLPCLFFCSPHGRSEDEPPEPVPT